MIHTNLYIYFHRDDVKTPNTTTRKSSTSSNNTLPKGNKIASASTQRNGEWLPDSRKSAHTPTLAANLNTTPKSITKSIHSTHAAPTPASEAVVPPPVASPASTTSTSSGSSSSHGLPPPRPPKDGLQYANLDKTWMQDPRNRVLPGSTSVPATTYATVTREVTQTSSRTFGGNQKI